MEVDTFVTTLRSIAILLVCRNRRDTTLSAIRRLQDQTLGLACHIVLFDDASTDGTVEAVLAQAPNTIIVRGDGNAFWNGGLHQCWSAALSLPVDAFLWLNDDVELDADAFERIARVWHTLHSQEMAEHFVLVGSTRGVDGVVTYGGFDRVPAAVAFRLERVAPADELIPIDTFNGNIVLVPRRVVERIGINDPSFHHNLGDLDYGLRARAAGIPVFLLPGTIGRCEANAAKSERGYGSRHLSLREQWRKVNSHHGLPFRSWWRFTRRHSGAWQPLHFILPYRKLLLPQFRNGR